MAAAGGRNGMISEEIIRWMKFIPAKYIPHNVRVELSKILDPPRPLIDTDYRSFADRSGLVPAIWQWLDSQKIEGKTSSICLILDYLQDTCDNYTVYDVFKTLHDMRSAAEGVILQRMPDIIRMFNGGTRPGQEHTEPPSFNSVASGNRSPPPPYTFSPGPEGSNDIVTAISGDPLNDLGGACVLARNPTVQQIHCPIPYPGMQFMECQPGENSFQGQDPFPLSEPGLSRPGQSSFLPVPNPGCINGREPDENSCSFADGSASPYMCGSRSTTRSYYVPSQVQPHSGFPRMPTTQMSPTAMMELKPHIIGPVVEVCEPYKDGTHDTYQFQPSQRASYPVTKPVSYKSRAPTSRPISDGRFYSDQQTVVKQKFKSSDPDSMNQRYNATQNIQLSSGGLAVSPSFRSSNTASHLIRNGSFSVAQGERSNPNPVCSSPAERGNITPVPSDKRVDSGCQSLPVTSPAPATPWQLQRHPSESEIFSLAKYSQSAGSAMSQQLPRHQSETAMASVAKRSQRRSGYFVFILAADIEETSQLSQQVISLTEELKKLQIPHVAVTSTVHAPIIYDLPSHLESSLSTQTNGDAHRILSISACFHKAAKVLMMVSPGYLRYADKYSMGAASNVASNQQETIRGFHQELKQEFFDKKDRIRVWPVLYLKAEPNHMPSFLRESIYYFYPPEPNSEDLLALLKWEWDQYKG